LWLARSASSASRSACAGRPWSVASSPAIRESKSSEPQLHPDHPPRSNGELLMRGGLWSADHGRPVWATTLTLRAGSPAHPLLGDLRFGLGVPSGISCDSGDDRSGQTRFAGPNRAQRELSPTPKGAALWRTPSRSSITRIIESSSNGERTESLGVIAQGPARDLNARGCRSCTGAG
jgi:hypothetical protein